MFTDVVHAMAGAPGQGAGAQGPGAMISSFMPLILIFGIFYFLLIRPQQKKAKEHKQMILKGSVIPFMKEHKQMMDDLKKGDKVMTNGGLHGVIDDIDGETLTLKIGVGSDLKVKVNRGHIATIRGKE